MAIESDKMMHVMMAMQGKKQWLASQEQSQRWLLLHQLHQVRNSKRAVANAFHRSSPLSPAAAATT
jgi:hypothetical protein